jgi:tRNA (cytidine/uridine-2'-O-)-methyltransferase
MKIILIQPQIPQNTGNIARTCSVTGAQLLLVLPLGFSTASRHLKRAGLDYWADLDVQEIDQLEDYLAKNSAPFFFYSSKATQCYTEAPYTDESQLIFGSEESGLPDRFLEKWPEHFYRIPMKENSRCLNLGTSAAIVLYEAMRRTSFSTLKK